jgi:hypothetical protein
MAAKSPDRRGSLSRFGTANSLRRTQQRIKAEARLLEALGDAVRGAISPLLSSKKHGVYLNACPAHQQVLMDCGIAPERAKGSGIKTSASMYAASSTMSAGTAGSDGAGALRCNDCGGWRRHFVRVACQLINVRDGFGV